MKCGPAELTKGCGDNAGKLNNEIIIVIVKLLKEKLGPALAFQKLDWPKACDAALAPGGKNAPDGNKPSSSATKALFAAANMIALHAIWLLYLEE